ncbi:hypothetical protein [Pseudarthrobacter sp. H2]|uniref:hypothetical protein n=1 Tax=Pseudarthrobacter sp. H2 TaxID=3418415 RepID=UPI003CF8CC5F
MSTLPDEKLMAREPVTRKYGQLHVGERGLTLCGLAAAAFILVDVGGPLVASFKLATWLIVPGWVFLRRLPVANPATRLAGTVVTSGVLAAVFSLLMAWTGLWHPRLVAIATLAAASALIFLTARSAGLASDPARLWINRLRQCSLVDLVPWLILGGALLMWSVALAATDTGQLGDMGLLVAYPATWFIAVGLATALCVWGVVARRVGSTWIMSASITGLVVMLYASASLLTSVPRLPWTYKHIAVTDFVSAAGRVDPSIDIYNRWPGFFSVSAFLGEVIGYRDALAYASWAEIGFALADVLIVVAIARAISTNPRVYWTAALVFTLTNWVGQNYYAPQAFAFTLYLAMCLTALTFLRSTPFKRVRWSTGVRPRSVAASDDFPGRAVRIAAVVAILVLQGVIAATHQLTPYMAVLGLCPLFLFGFFKPRWAGPVLLAIAIGYLLPNWDYVDKSYGLLSGVDFLGNASYRLTTAGTITEAAQWQALAVNVLSALTAVLALAGYVRHFLRGEAQITLLVGWLAAAPLFVLLGQSYGGEGRLRVYLFALPWLSIGVAWLFWSGPLRTRRAVYGAALSLAAMALLFTAVYFQPEAKYRVAEADVIASKWLDARVHNGDLVFQTYAEYFPLLIGRNYPFYLHAGEPYSLQYLLNYGQDRVSPGDVENYIDNARSADRKFIVFSDSQQRYAVQEGLLHVSVFPKIENELATSGKAEKIFDNGSARIYQLITTGRAANITIP